MTVTWTAPALATTTHLWREGYSAGEISKELARELSVFKTRNAVIGKLHRLGLCKDRVPSMVRAVRTERKQRKGPAQRKVQRKSKPLAKEPPQPIEPLNVPILDVSPFQCRAVVDTTEWGNAKLCGHVVAEGSWCAAHAAMFFNLVERKRAA